jgi:tetratricopeptide (TPR) repeat protein
MVRFSSNPPVQSFPLRGYQESSKTKSKTMKKIYSCYRILILVVCLSSCKKFLDEKANKTWKVPSTLEDYSAILDNVNNLNTLNIIPFFTQASCDDYYFDYNDWRALPEQQRNLYFWNQQEGEDWFTSYQAVFYANTVLEGLETLENSPAAAAEYNRVKGSAMFFRAFAYFGVSQAFCGPYQLATAKTDMGIPLRTHPDFNQTTSRASNYDTYRQIITDLESAAALLPSIPLFITRPSRPAAYALLARTYLSMEDYQNAGRYADSCLTLSHELLDYNSLNASLSAPINRFNVECIFFCQNSFSNLTPSICKVDSALFRSYEINDLRRSIFFALNSNGSYRFKGHYNGSVSHVYFVGLATDEMYLIRAECYARESNKNAALADLNTLLSKRYKQGLFTPIAANTAYEALVKIIQERRKELLFRSIRWSDLRRLNKEPQFAVTLTRNVNGTIFSLPPNSSRYVSLINSTVISLTHIPQNPR